MDWKLFQFKINISNVWEYIDSVFLAGFLYAVTSLYFGYEMRVRPSKWLSHCLACHQNLKKWNFADFLGLNPPPLSLLTFCLVNISFGAKLPLGKYLWPRGDISRYFLDPLVLVGQIYLLRKLDFSVILLIQTTSAGIKWWHAN